METRAQPLMAAPVTTGTGVGRHRKANMPPRAYQQHLARARAWKRANRDQQTAYKRYRRVEQRLANTG